MDRKVVLSKTDLRKLQLIELEMLAEVDRICRKNNIQYSIDGGTLLGAVRHQGFIPWDDDADIVFTRREYAKFYRACKKDLDRSRFFLQEYRTDDNYRWGYAKLRRKGTEFVRIGQEQMKYRTGVCIDLFVNDNVPDGYLSRRMYYAVQFCIRKALYSELGQTAAPNCFLRGWYSLLYKIPRDWLFLLRNCLAARCNRKPTGLVSHLMWPYPAKSCKYGMPSACFQEYQDICFEGIRFRAFSDYDTYLKLLYGDYWKLPPVEKRVGPGEASKIQLIDITLEEIQDRYCVKEMEKLCSILQ